jgi:hypothetical protein
MLAFEASVRDTVEGPLTGVGRRARALMPGTRPTLGPYRSPRVYELSRDDIHPTAQKRPGISEQRERGDGRRADESLRPRSGYAVRSAWLTRPPPDTRHRPADAYRVASLVDQGCAFAQKSVRSRPIPVHEKRSAGPRHGVGMGAPRRVLRTLSRSAFFRPAEPAFRSECASLSDTFTNNPG